MRRAGGWVLGVVAVAAMAGGTWLAFRPILNRETLSVYYERGERGPTDDAILSGLEFAVREAGGRAGGCALKLETKDAGNPSIRFRIFSSDAVLLEARIEDPEGSEVRFRCFVEEERLVHSAAAWAAAAGNRSAVLLDSSRYQKEFEAAGLNVLGTTPFVNDPVIMSERILRWKPDLVFYDGEKAPYHTTFELFDGLRKRGYQGTLLTIDGEPTVSFLAAPTDVVEGTLLVSPIPPPSREFADVYEPATARHAGPHAWPGYLLGKAILGVINEAGSARGADLISACRGHPPRVYPSVLYQFKEGKFVFVQELK